MTIFTYNKPSKACNLLSLKTHHYSFGSPMPGRSFNSGDYKYGFNGKENDDEIKGQGNSVDFGAREFDPRLARWWSGDAKESKYPHLSPYNFAANNPILLIDPDGNVIEPSPGMTDAQKVKYDAVMKKVTEKLPDLISYLQTVRVHEDDGGNQTFILPGQEGYEKAFDVVIQVGFGNIDGIDGKKEKEANEGDGFGVKISYGGSKGISSHLDGVTKPFIKYIGLSADRKNVYVTDPTGANTDKKEITCEADLTQTGSRFRSLLLPREPGGKAHFEITMDDYITPGTSEGAVFSHEFGHVEGILKNFSNFVYMAIKSNGKTTGHEEGDKGGEKAVEKEKQYEKK